MAPYFLCTVFVSQFDSTCMDRPPLIVCTTHLHTMKSYGREGERERRETENRLGEVEEGKWKKDWWEGKEKKM